MTKRFGFTLAEVLITLGIIGVVAAMTIPTLMNQTGAAEFRTGFKKAISVLNQAITMNVALESADFSVLESSNGANSILAMFQNRMNVSSTDTAGTADLGTGTHIVAGNYTVFLTDGMAVSFPSTYTLCAAAGDCPILVDVNGTKRPNKLTTIDADGNEIIGDQFGVDVFNQQVLPYGEAARRVMFQ